MSFAAAVSSSSDGDLKAHVPEEAVARLLAAEKMEVDQSSSLVRYGVAYDMGPRQDCTARKSEITTKTPLELAQERAAAFYAAHKDPLNPSLKAHSIQIAAEEQQARRAAAAAEVMRVQQVNDRLKATKCENCAIPFKSAGVRRKGGQWENNVKKSGKWVCGPCNLGEEWVEDFSSSAEEY